jgi:hypothetical protein
MTSRLRPDRLVNYPKQHENADTSMDKERHENEDRHHPEDHPHPHPPHHPQANPTGISRHHPHTHPDDQVLNIDHGTHENRPRPGKIAKKSNYRAG